MRRSFSAMAAAATLAAALTAGSGPADARNRGGAIAAGVLGGLAAGAIIGGVIANGPAHAAPPPGYAPPPPGYAPPPPGYYRPVCHIERQRYWDGYAWRWQRVEVCD